MITQKEQAIIQYYLEESRIVLGYKIQKALDIGNISGVQRLAKFVGVSSMWPDQIYDACEQQRVWYYQTYKK